MSDYSKATNFTAKDSLPSGNSNKIVKGSEIDNEFIAISSAIASKADINSPTLTGTPAAPTATAGSNTTQIANTAFVKAAFDTLGTMSTQNANAVAVTGGTISGVTITGGTVSSLAADVVVADGGTGASTFTQNSVVLGNGTSPLNGNMVAPGTQGNVLTSNGTTWVSSAIGGAKGQGFTSSGTFTIPAGISAIKVTVVGGGGGGQGNTSGGAPGGGGGGAAISFLTGLTPGNTLAVTIGAGSTGTGGTSSVASGTQSISTISATGGAAAVTSGGAGGTGSGGTINISGEKGEMRDTAGVGDSTGDGGKGGDSILGFGGAALKVSENGLGNAGQLYGGGGGGSKQFDGVTSGAAGIVIFEW
jgi:hypothetical protein